jgi:hypothetical protein
MGNVLAKTHVISKDYIIFHSSIKPPIVHGEFFKTVIYVGETNEATQALVACSQGVMNIFFLFCHPSFVDARLRWFHRYRDYSHNVYIFGSPLRNPIDIRDLKSTVYYDADLQRRKEFEAMSCTNFISRDMMIDRLLQLGVHSEVAQLDTYRNKLPFSNTPVVDFEREHLFVCGNGTVVIFSNGIAFAKKEQLDEAVNIFFVDITNECLELPVKFENAKLVMFLRCNTYFISDVADKINIMRMNATTQPKILPDMWIHAKPDELPCFDGPTSNLLFNAEAFTKNQNRVPVELLGMPLENIKQDRDFAALVKTCAAHNLILNYYTKHRLVYLNENSFFQIPTFSTNKTLKRAFVMVPCQHVVDPFVIEASYDAWKNHGECPVSPYAVLPLLYSIGREEADAPALRKKTAELIVLCEHVVFYMDDKSTWTEDMKFYHKEALFYGKNIIYRKIGSKSAASL